MNDSILYKVMILRIKNNQSNNITKINKIKKFDIKFKLTKKVFEKSTKWSTY